MDADKHAEKQANLSKLDAQAAPTAPLITRELAQVRSYAQMAADALIMAQKEPRLAASLMSVALDALGLCRG